jgi:hypothetical protein
VSDTGLLDERRRDIEVVRHRDTSSASAVAPGRWRDLWITGIPRQETLDSKACLISRVTGAPSFRSTGPFLDARARAGVRHMQRRAMRPEFVQSSYRVPS